MNLLDARNVRPRGYRQHDPDYIPGDGDWAGLTPWLVVAVWTLIVWGIV